MRGLPRTNGQDGWMCYGITIKGVLYVSNGNWKIAAQEVRLNF